MAHAASSKEMVADAADQAVWLVEGFVPGPKSVGVIEAVKMGAKPYPMLPQMGLMHGALGSFVFDFSFCIIECWFKLIWFVTCFKEHCSVCRKDFERLQKLIVIECWFLD
jgi:hypothetical protein